MREPGEEATPQGATPHDLDMERMLLAAIIADNRAMDRLGDLEPDDLFDHVHNSVLAAALDIKRAGGKVNLITLRGRFGSVPFGDGSVFQYLQNLSFAGSMPDIGDVCAALRELKMRRDIQALGEQIAGSVWDQAAGPATILADTGRALDDLLARCRSKRKTLSTMSEAIDDLMHAIEVGDTDRRVPTGLTDLDNMLGGGWRKGEYVILGGRPSMGKTATAVSFAHNAARKGFGVLTFSLEMTTRQWTARTVADETARRAKVIPYSNFLRRGGLSDEERAILNRVAQSQKTLPLLIDEAAGLNATEIGSRVRRAAEMLKRDGMDLDLVIVDHLGKLKPSKHHRGNRVQEMGELSNAMFELAKNEDVAVVALHQLNRGTEQRDNKRPTLPDLRDAGNIEQDADAVLFCYREAYYLERTRYDDPNLEDQRQKALAESAHVLEIIVAKQRNGAVGIVPLYCDMASNSVRDAVRQDRAMPDEGRPEPARVVYSAAGGNGRG